jgi:NAD(P)-dependent dehydrogenase (short-subunit alcohol dehydrogenase family)
MTETMAAALEPHGIGASVLCPGLVASGMAENGPLVRAMLQFAPAPVFDQRSAAAWAHEQIMDPLTVGRLVVRGVLENRVHIFTHPDRASEVVTRHEQLLADLEWARTVIEPKGD